jgi:hypothetical protein
VAHGENHLDEPDPATARAAAKGVSLGCVGLLGLCGLLWFVALLIAIATGHWRDIRWGGIAVFIVWLCGSALALRWLWRRADRA